MSESAGRLRSAFGLTDQQALFVLRLYEAGGDKVDHWQMEAALPPWSGGRRMSGFAFIPTIACYVRRKLGRSALRNERLSYRLTPQGMAKVYRALNDRARSDAMP